MGQAIRIQCRQRTGILGYAGIGLTKTLAKRTNYPSKKVARARTKSPYTRRQSELSKPWAH